MKNLRDIDKEHGHICAVWKNSPSDPKPMHTRDLFQFKTLEGKIIFICSRCRQNMIDLRAFLDRKTIAPKQSILVYPKPNQPAVGVTQSDL